MTTGRTFRRPWRVHCAALLAGVWLLAPAPARADWNLDFQSPLPPNFVTTGLTAAGTPSPTFSAAIDSGVLRFRDTVLPGSGGAAVGFGVIANDVFTDVRVTGTLNPAGGSRNDLVLLARAHVPTVSSYAAGVNFSTGPASGVAYILKFVNGREVDNALNTDPEQGSQPRLPVDTSYYIQFDAVGNQLSLRVFDAPGGTQVAHVDYSDSGVGGARFTSGPSGVANQVLGNTLLNGTFDNVSARVIPEPANFLLALLAGVFSVRTRPRPHRRECE